MYAVQLLPKLADVLGISLDTLFGRPAPVTVQSGLPWENDGDFHIVVYCGHELLGSSKAGPHCTFTYEGPVRDIYCELNLECGAVQGNVTAGGYVECGDVVGDVSAGGYAETGDVTGSVAAGDYVECGDVGGGITAGNYVECGDVVGSVFSGSTVECGESAWGEGQFQGNMKFTMDEQIQSKLSDFLDSILKPFQKN